MATQTPQTQKGSGSGFVPSVPSPDVSRILPLIERALKTINEDPAFRLNLGKIRLKYSTGTASVESAKKEFEAFKRMHPNPIEAHYKVGMAWLEAGYLKLAIEELEKVVKLDPNHVDAHYHLGIEYLGCCESYRAEVQFATVLKLDPNHADAHYQLGAIQPLCRSEEAIREFREALRIDPNHAKAHYRLGGVYYRKAIREFGEAARSADAEMHHKLAYEHLRSARPVEAARELKEIATARNSDSLPWLVSLREAIKELKEALRINPHDGKAHSKLGFAYKYEGRLDEAIRNFEEIARVPGNAPHDLHYKLGLAYLQKGEVDKAIAALREQVHESGWGDGHEIYYSALGDAYTRKGQLGKARKVYEVAATLAGAQNHQYEIPPRYHAARRVRTFKLGGMSAAALLAIGVLVTAWLSLQKPTIASAEAGRMPGIESAENEAPAAASPAPAKKPVREKFGAEEIRAFAKVFRVKVNERMPADVHGKVTFEITVGEDGKASAKVVEMRGMPEGRKAELEKSANGAISEIPDAVPQPARESSFQVPTVFR